MTTFFNSVYKLISLPIQGTWTNAKQTYEFRLQDKKNPEPGNIVEIVLYIDKTEQGVVDFEFSPKGTVSVVINGEKHYEIGSMFWNRDDESYTMELKDGKNLISLQKAY